MTYLRLFGTFFRVGVLSELQYRANFVVQLFQSMLNLGTGLGALAVVFSHTHTLAGWSQDELLVVLAIYFLVGGAINLVIRPGMQRFMEDVRMGTLDFALTKPTDTQFLISLREVDIWKMFDVLLGSALLLIALLRLAAHVGISQAGGFALTMLAGAAIVYSFWMILATLTFWVVRADNILVIFVSLYEAGRWPVTIYPNALRWALTALVPVAFAVTVPAEAITGRLTASMLLGSVSLALFLLALSRWFWRFGIRHYSGASS